MKSDREGEVLYEIPYGWDLKRIDTNEFIYKTEADSKRAEQIHGCWGRGEDKGKGQLRSLGWTGTHCDVQNG